MTLEEVTEQTSFRYLPWTHNTGRIYQISGDANAYANILETRLTQAEEDAARLLDELNRVKAESAQVKQELTAELNAHRFIATKRITELEGTVAIKTASLERHIELARSQEISASEAKQRIIDLEERLASVSQDAERQITELKQAHRREQAARMKQLLTRIETTVNDLWMDGN